jgi:hypothetical protein
LSNAVRHPNASFIQTVSKFDRSDDPITLLGEQNVKEGKRTLTKTQYKGHLRIYIWDDGDSIVDTLLPIIRSEKPIRGVELPSFMYDSIRLQVRDYQKKEISEATVNQGENPPPNASEELILLSSLFPGVSRTVAEQVGTVETFDEAVAAGGSVTWADKQGMGLYSLTRTALDLYQGSLFIRSGQHRLVIEMAHDAFRKAFSVSYKAKVTRYPTNFPKFKGNLLGIFLPIKA